MGPPGSGKGTISALIVEKFGVKHISSGDLLRMYFKTTQTANPALATMNEGKLVSDDLIQEVVLPELIKYSQSSHGLGWLLDGFPRTLTQAKSLCTQEKINMMINLNVPDETIIERLQGRWVHIESGRLYHSIFNPPKVDGIDDVTGEKLHQREDDRSDVVKQRLSHYHEQTKPVIDYFNKLNVLKTYSGTHSKMIWPHIEKNIAEFLEQ